MAKKNRVESRRQKRLSRRGSNGVSKPTQQPTNGAVPSHGAPQASAQPPPAAQANALPQGRQPEYVVSRFAFVAQSVRGLRTLRCTHEEWIEVLGPIIEGLTRGVVALPDELVPAFESALRTTGGVPDPSQQG